LYSCNKNTPFVVYLYRALKKSSKDINIKEEDMKTPRILGTLILAFLLVTAMTGCSTPAYAVEGTVESVSQGPDGITIVVDGKTIVIPDAQIAGMLAEGTVVKIEFEVDDNGSLVALEIELEDEDNEDLDDEDTDGKQELKGTIESLTDTSVVINGQTIVFGDNIEIEGILEVGASVEIEYVEDNGSLVALGIEVEDEDNDDLDDEDSNEDTDDDDDDSGSDDD
jgi:hypothetical protein